LRYTITTQGRLTEGRNTSNKQFVQKVLIDLFDSSNWTYKFDRNVILTKNSNQTRKYTILLKEITPAQRRNDKEYRMQIRDKEISLLKDSKNNQLTSNSLFSEEILIPFGYFHDISSNVLIFSTFDPRRIDSEAQTRSYYIDIEYIAKAQLEGISFFHDSAGERVISFLPTNLMGVINNMDLFFE